MDTEVTVFEGIRILYEDNHLIVCIKPAGVLSQSDGSDAPDMLTILKRYIKEKYEKPGEVYLGLVHRLDRPVSGPRKNIRRSGAAAQEVINWCCGSRTMQLRMLMAVQQ